MSPYHETLLNALKNYRRSWSSNYRLGWLSKKFNNWKLVSRQNPAGAGHSPDAKLILFGLFCRH
jgi:hypothetical protein